MARERRPQATAAFSRLTRWLVPDDISLNLSFSFSFVVGLNFSGALHLLTRGPDAGFHVTGSYGPRVGWEGGVSLTLSKGTFLGNAENATVNSLLGNGYDASGGYLIFSASAWESVRGNNPLPPT